MRVRTTTFLASAALLAAASATVPTAAHAPFGRIVVFGTSLSDSGNAFALRGGTNTPPDYLLDPLLVPSAPYARGGHHFSNGATWIEQFARSMGLAGSVRPAFRASTPRRRTTRLARREPTRTASTSTCRRRWTRFSSSSAALPRPMACTPSKWAAMTSGTPLSCSRAVVMAARFSRPPTFRSPTASERSTARARGTFSSGEPRTSRLRRRSARWTRVSPGAAQLATGLTQGFNAGLDGVVAQLSGLPGIRIVRLDAYRMLNDLVARPGGVWFDECDDGLHHAEHSAVHLRSSRRVPLLGRHSSEQGRSRHHRAGSGLRAGALTVTPDRRGGHSGRPPPCPR